MDSIWLMTGWPGRADGRAGGRDSGLDGGVVNCGLAARDALTGVQCMHVICTSPNVLVTTYLTCVRMDGPGRVPAPDSSFVYQCHLVVCAGKEVCLKSRLD